MYIYVQWPLYYRTQVLCTTKAMHGPCVRHIVVMECHPCTNTDLNTALLNHDASCCTILHHAVPFLYHLLVWPSSHTVSHWRPAQQLHFHLPRLLQCLYSNVPLATCPVVIFIYQGIPIAFLPVYHWRPAQLLHLYIFRHNF